MLFFEGVWEVKAKGIVRYAFNALDRQTLA
jgi:hypothetical protein